MPAGVTILIPILRHALASLAFARTRFHFDRNYCLIVERLNACGMLGHCFEDFIHRAVRGFCGAASDDCLQTLLPKGLAMSISCIQNSVTDKDEEITGLCFETHFVVVRFVEQAKGQSGYFDRLDL